MDRHRLVKLIVPLSLVLLASCTPALPVPRVGPHVGEVPTIVPFPPPPAQPEVIPARPKEKGSVWVDGEWQWKGRRWVWQRGSWQVPYPGSYWAPGVTIRQQDGSLAYFQGGWRTRNSTTGKVTKQ
jgi:hypothetical protein